MSYSSRAFQHMHSDDDTYYDPREMSDRYGLGRESDPDAEPEIKDEIVWLENGPDDEPNAGDLLDVPVAAIPDVDAVGLGVELYATYQLATDPDERTATRRAFSAHLDATGVTLDEVRGVAAIAFIHRTETAEANAAMWRAQAERAGRLEADNERLRAELEVARQWKLETLLKGGRS